MHRCRKQIHCRSYGVRAHFWTHEPAKRYVARITAQSLYFFEAVIHPTHIATLLLALLGSRLRSRLAFRKHLMRVTHTQVLIFADSL